MEDDKAGIKGPRSSFYALLRQNGDDAAWIGCVGLQIVHDQVLRLNAASNGLVSGRRRFVCARSNG